MIIISILIFLVASVKASLYVGFPLSEQLPNVARVDQYYNFQMANVTFKSTNGNGNVQFYATNLPKWLSFDNSSRVFTGTPSSDDVTDGISITLNGIDLVDNSTISKDYTFMVSSEPGIELSSDDVMFNQISAYGNTNGHDGLVVKPGQSFNIKFNESVFKKIDGETRDIVSYYGRSADRSSLPNWISFDSDDLSFKGIVPFVTSTNAPSVEYGFSFIATDYTGFAGAEGIFKLVVGGHQLSITLNETIKINGTLDKFFDIDIPILSVVKLDNQAITRDNISSVYSENIPDFITLNENNYTLTGTFPEKSTFENFSISVEDNYGNVVYIPYSFDAIGSAFTVSSLPDVNATKGEYFSYQLMNSYFTENNTNVTVQYSGADWLKFHSDNKTFNGNVPSDFSKIEVSVNAVSEFNDDSLDFNIKGISKELASATSTSSSSSATSSPTSTATTASTGAANSNDSSKGINKKALAIGLGVGIPCFLILIAAIIICCCLVRRRRRKNEQDQSTSEGDNEKSMTIAHSPEITGPGFGTSYNNNRSDMDISKELNAINISQLEGGVPGKVKYDSDAESTSSSLTHVESKLSSDYYDASEIPTKSWRAKDASDAAFGKLNGKYRKSDASMSTVNTENLFSVRLVDDSARNSNRSSFSNRYFSNGSLNGALKRDSSGNIQRLDSDGNIVDYDVSLNRSKSSNLAGIIEENSKDMSNTTEYHSAEGQNQELNSDHEQSNNNLLSKFQNPSTTTSASNSDNQLSSRAYESDNSFVDDFRVISNADGDVRWSIHQNSSDVLHNIGDSRNKSPLMERFSGLSATDTSLSGSDNRHSTSSLGKKAKLVDFTRKGSLKNAEYQHAYFTGETADIREDDSD